MSYTRQEEVWAILTDGIDDRTLSAWLDLPLRWQKPRKILLAGDLFATHSVCDIPDHEDGFIAEVYGVMCLARQHTFTATTRNQKRLASWLASYGLGDCLAAVRGDARLTIPGHETRRDRAAALEALYSKCGDSLLSWPPANVKMEFIMYEGEVK